MPTTANAAGYGTMLDIARQRNPNGGGLLPLVETLTKLKPILGAIQWAPCNNGTFHRISQQRALPTNSKRQLGSGIAPTKGQTQQVDETTVMRSAMTQIDQTLIKLNGSGYRMQQAGMHLESLEQNVEGDLLYGSAGDSGGGFDGIITRLAATTQTPAGTQIILDDPAAGGSDQASVLLLGFGSHAVHGIYPTGTMAGLDHQDLGLQVLDDGDNSGNVLPQFVDWFEWHYGLAIEDWRYVARGANVDTGNLQADSLDLARLMIRLTHLVKIEDRSVTWAFVVPRTVATYLDLQADARVVPNLATQNIGGAIITSFRGIPIYTADKMLITEDVVA